MQPDPRDVDALVERGTYEKPAHGWTCFHCGDNFTTPGAARDHFGFDIDCEPACRIKAGGERGLLMALRKAESELADCRNEIATESTEAARAYYAQMTRHNAQLMAVEQAGYDKGLADGRDEAATTIAALQAEVARKDGRLRRTESTVRAFTSHTGFDPEGPCPICGGIEGCSHSFGERLRAALERTKS